MPDQDKRRNDATDKYVDALISSWPPLTEAQKHQVAAILRPTLAKAQQGRGAA